MNDLDGTLFKKYAHAMDASLRKLFDHVAEQDKKYGLMKEESANEFLNNEVNSLNCGNKNYIFNFKDDFTMNVSITDNIKTDYNLISSFELMRGLLEVSDSINEGFDFIIAKLSDKNYDEAAIVMQDILDAYTNINLRIDTFSRFLRENNLHAVNTQFKESLLEVVEHFNHEHWNSLRNELIQRVIPYFLLWKKELHNTFTLYITH